MRPDTHRVLAGEVEQVAAGAAEFSTNLVALHLALPEMRQVLDVDRGAVHDSSLKSGKNRNYGRTKFVSTMSLAATGFGDVLSFGAI
jgi:hypothetical protein